MTEGPSTNSVSDEERITAIRARLASLRARTAALTERAQEATAHANETRAAARASCNHAAEAAEMRSALDAVEHELEGLRVAMHTRGVIEQAKGMLMAQEHCDEETAFAMLVSMSQKAHVKLIEVCRTLVTTFSARENAQA